MTKYTIDDKKLGSQTKVNLDEYIHVTKEALEQMEQKEEIRSRMNVKKHLEWIFISTMWVFLGFLVVYLVFVIINSFDSINIKGVISMREVISIVFAFGAGSVISNQFKNFLKS